MCANSFRQRWDECMAGKKYIEAQKSRHCFRTTPESTTCDHFPVWPHLPTLRAWQQHAAAGLWGQRQHHAGSVSLRLPEPSNCPATQPSWHRTCSRKRWCLEVAVQAIVGNSSKQNRGRVRAPQTSPTFERNLWHPRQDMAQMVRGLLIQVEISSLWWKSTSKAQAVLNNTSINDEPT